MLKAFIRSRLGQALVDRLIERAMRTPYFHLFHDDGRPYMQRYWLMRIGPRQRAAIEHRILLLTGLLDEPDLNEVIRARAQAMLANQREKLYPWIGIRIHHIVSSDERVCHDHPWSFATLILRGGYTESTPITPDGVALRRHRYTAGSLRFMPAESWHYLTLEPGESAWTLFFTFRKRQSWGFLVNGVKMPWRDYLAQRSAASKADGA